MYMGWGGEELTSGVGVIVHRKIAAAPIVSIYVLLKRWDWGKSCVIVNPRTQTRFS